jgi:hypothetical protein
MTAERSAAPLCPDGVPTAMKQTRVFFTASARSVVNVSRPSVVLRRMSSSSPGS